MTHDHLDIRLLRAVLPIAALLLLPFRAAPAAAQDTTQVQRMIRERTGTDMSTEEILRRLRESGMTREQIRARLRQAGYDPSLADRYFDELARGDTTDLQPRGNTRFTRRLPRPTGDLLEALSTIGVLPDTAAVSDTLADIITSARDRRERLRRDSLRAATPQIFGMELFSATTTEFQPVMTGPVDPDYKLGPGDQMALIMTGDVEQGYNLEVTREGFIVIPNVGQVRVAGLTIEELKRLLNGRLARVYSGVQTGSTTFDLAMGRLRRNLVHIIGEVDIPGAYPVGGGATVFNALYQAGGPNENGSFRRIQVRRNNEVIREVDLYQYLLSGDKGSDVRLEQSDIVFVPVVARRVTITGSVRRPAIYELKPDESLRDVLRFAGGVQAEAALERIQIDRILPPDKRTPGMERAIVDVSLAQVNGSEPFALQDGDLISVFAITKERRNRVTITGDVRRPGLHEFRAGMTAQDLIGNAQGLLPTAYTPAANIVRLNPADSTTTLVRIVLDDTTATNYAGRVPLLDLDELIVFGRAQLINPDSVRITGYVKEEGAYPFSDGISVQDLVLRAGGFREGAYELEAEVARRRTDVMRGDSLAPIFRVPLGLPASSGVVARNGVPEFELLPGDHVYIRRRPGYEPVQTITMLGEVMYPGDYPVEPTGERVSRLIRRAGGLTPRAYPQGLQVLRDGMLVAVNLRRALEQPGRAEDLIIRPNDTLTVPVYDGTVLVTGAVAFESRVRYEPRFGVLDYLDRAGGTLAEADQDRISVRYPNGELRTTREILTVNSYPRVEPGSEIFVPTKKLNAVNWGAIITQGSAILSALLTAVVLVNQLQ